MTRTYEQVTAELAQRRIHALDGETITSLGNHPFDRFSRLFFDFGPAFLDRQNMPFDIQPARLYFNSLEKSIEACSWHHSTTDYYLIEVNRGVVKNVLNHFYDDNERFSGPLFILFRHWASKTDYEPGFILFQTVALYILYHEAGHLVQKNIESGRYPTIQPGRERSRETLEQHADNFSAFHLADHFQGYIKRIEEKYGRMTTAEFETGAALILAALPLFHFASTDVQIYFDLHSHPHSAVRLPVLVTCFLQHLRTTTGRPFDPNRLTGKAILLATHLIRGPLHNPALKFAQLVSANSAGLNRYRRELLAALHEFPFASTQLVYPARLQAW